MLPEKTFKLQMYLAIKYFGCERNSWRLFQKKRVVCTKFDIFVFTYQVHLATALVAIEHVTSLISGNLYWLNK